MTMAAQEQVQGGSEKAAGAGFGVERQGYSVREFAAMFGVSEQIVRSGIRSGEISVIHFGRRHIIPKTEVERLIRT
jgi:excisionase family DNA binding protein